jgi:hypothetical protein
MWMIIMRVVSLGAVPIYVAGFEGDKDGAINKAVVYGNFASPNGKGTTVIRAEWVSEKEQDTPCAFGEIEV